MVGLPFPIEATPVLVAHRAGNDAERARAALDKVDVIELDVHVFRRRVEVRHEKVLWPTARLWEKWRFLPAGTTVPTIDPVLEAVPADVPLLVDLKCFTRRAARRIRRAIPENRPLIVSSRSWWVLGAFRNRPATVALRSCGNELQMRLVTRTPGLSPHVGVVAHNRFLDRETIASVKARTPILFTWAVESVDRGRELADGGVTGLIVDDLSLGWADLRIVSGD